MVVSTQPIWKICSSNWVHLPQFSGWKFQKYLKPPPRCDFYMTPFCPIENPFQLSTLTSIDQALRHQMKSRQQLLWQHAVKGINGDLKGREKGGRKVQTHVIMMDAYCIVQSTLKASTFWWRYWIQVPSGQQQITFLNLCYIGCSWTQDFHLVKLGRLSLGHSKKLYCFGGFIDRCCDRFGMCWICKTPKVLLSKQYINYPKITGNSWNIITNTHSTM